MVETVESKMDQTLQATGRLKEMQEEGNQQFSHMPALLNLSTDMRSKVFDFATTIAFGQQPPREAINANPQVRTFLNKWQGLILTLMELREILERSPQLQRFIHENSLHTHSSQTQKVHSHDLETHKEMTSSLRRICTCKKTNRITILATTSILHSRKVVKRQHHRRCPKSNTSMTELEFLMKIIPPIWLLSHVIYLGFSICYWNSKSSWKISPFIVGAVRLVDSSQSPAFRGFKHLKSLRLSKVGIQPVQIRNLERSIKDMLRCRVASVFDEDRYGNTLLYEVLKLYILGGSPRDNSCDQDFLSLIRFSIDSGSNPNTFHQAGNLEERWIVKGGGTALDMFAKRLLCEDLHFRRERPVNTLVYTQLIDNGAQFSRPFTGCIEDSLGRRPLHLAVACRQDETDILLLKAECSLYTPEYSSSLLQESLKGGRKFDHVTSRIIEALIDRHTRLLEWAMLMLPDAMESREQLQQHSISEREASKLIDTLTKWNCIVPPSLEVDRDGEGVYDTADLQGTIRLTSVLADKLWDGGFHRVDDYAPINKLTPLLQSWFIGDLDMISWFVKKGASPFSKSHEYLHCGLHLYAARLAYPGVYFIEAKNIPIHQELFQQLTERRDMWHDSCSCLCSSEGCTPISITFKQYHGFDHMPRHSAITKILRILHSKLLYQPEKYPDHIQQLLSAVTFEEMQLFHTCCCIGQLGQGHDWEPWQLRGRRRYSDQDVDVEFKRRLHSYNLKMLECRCSIVYKPLCALLDYTCKKKPADT